MRAHAWVEPLRRWSVAALGALLCGAVVLAVVVNRPERTALYHLQIGIPILLALGLAAYGGWLVQSGLAADRVRRIALWSLAGVVVLGSFAAWEMYTHALEGAPFAETLHELLLGATEGAAVGGIVGYYDARRLDQLQETKAAHEAISAAIDGIAILDEDERYTTVNRAHADVYGYDSPEDFVGESWRMCYSEAQLDVVEDEVLPTLREDGHWRGQLTGLRRDGTTFPQEISLTAMDDGGLVCVVRDVTERQKRERAIAALHDATREMMQETDSDTICQIAVDAAQNALDLPMSAIWLRSDDRSRLEPVAWSDRAGELFDELPAFEPDDSISWAVYESGEPRVYDDVSGDDDRLNSETELRSELIVPIGEYGVLNSGSADVGEFEETDVVLAQLLVANTRSALERAEREKELQRQTDRMEFFNSILRHDVLNGMTVIRGRAELLADELAGDQLRDAETIVDWCDDVVTIIRRVRTVLETLTGTDDPQLEAVDLSAVLRSEVERVRATYPAVAFETDVPDGAVVQANELLGEVLGNVITNAVDHNGTDGLCVSITVDGASDPTDGTVTVRIADDGRGVPDDRKEEIFRRDATGHAKSTGSGFGLFFVDAMVAEYGGDAWVEDNDDGGATFVIRLQAVDRAQ